MAAIYQWFTSPDGFQDYEAILYMTSQDYSIRMFGVNFDTGVWTLFGSAWLGGEHAMDVTIDETFVHRTQGTFSNYQYIWRGNCFSTVYLEDIGGNGPTDLLTIKGVQQYFTSGQEAFGHGMRAVGYETADPFDLTVDYVRTATSDDWNGLFDLRYGNNGLPEKGDALVCQPENSQNISTYYNNMGTLSLADQLSASSLGNKAAWSCDRDSGVMTSHFTAELYFRAYKIDMTDLSITYTGQLSPTVDLVIAAAGVPDYEDIFITLENPGGGGDYVRTYEHDGVGGLTMLDEFLVESGTSTGAHFRTSPFTKRMWLLSGNATIGLCAFRVDKFGTITRDIRIPGFSSGNTGFNGNFIGFIKDPNGMVITPNGFTGIKEKLYQSWEFDETGSVTREGSMTNFYDIDLPVLIGTVTDRAGALTKAADFPGEGAPAALQATLQAYHTEPRTQSSFTLSLEVEVDDLTQIQCLLARGRNDAGIDLSQFDFLLYADPLNDRFTWQVVVGSTYYSALAPVSGGMLSGTKYMLVVDYDKTNEEISIQLDADSKVTTALPDPSNINVYAAGSRFTVGRRTSYSTQPQERYFDGGMRRLRWFWDVLDTADRAWLYNGGAGQDFVNFGVPVLNNVVYGPDNVVYGPDNVIFTTYI